MNCQFAQITDISIQRNSCLSGELNYSSLLKKIVLTLGFKEIVFSGFKDDFQKSIQDCSKWLNSIWTHLRPFEVIQSHSKSLEAIRNQSKPF